MGDRQRRSVVVQGTGLHTGARVHVELTACDGAVCIAVGDAQARVDELTVVSSARATTVEACGGRLRLGTVEHLFSALAGLGIRRGLRVAVDGPELPLLDGGAEAWCRALDELGLAASSPSLRVREAAVIDVGSSRYELRPGDGVLLEVDVELDDDPRLDRRARWDGLAADYRRRIAPARTFALARDIADLLERGLARHVDRTSVVLVAPEAIFFEGRAFERDEPARHKLLDLAGDLYLGGGPPMGFVRAHRPGHAANVRALRIARERGVLVDDRA